MKKIRKDSHLMLLLLLTSLIVLIVSSIIILIQTFLFKHPLQLLYKIGNILILGFFFALSHFIFVLLLLQLLHVIKERIKSYRLSQVTHFFSCLKNLCIQLFLTFINNILFLSFINLLEKVSLFHD